jgi:Phospholipase_D-nuclease N-terminal
VPRVLLFLAVVMFGVWALIDVAQTPEARVRLLSKPSWSLAVLIPVLGPALWFLQGRTPQPSGSVAKAKPRPLAPDDDPDFLRRLRDRNHPDGSP